MKSAVLFASLNLLLAYFGLSINLNAQTPSLLWVKQFVGSDNGQLADEGSSVVVDANGNIYTTGYFTGIVDFDPGPGIYNLTSNFYFSSPTKDVFVSKLDASGNFLWAKKWGGNILLAGVDDTGKSIAVDANGNVYTTGYFRGTCDFNPDPNLNPAGTYNLTSFGSSDIFVSKLDANGNFLWAKQLGGGNTDGGFSIAVNAIGNVSTTGYFQGTADFDPGPGNYPLTSAGDNDIFISTLDASGNFLWAKSFGWPFYDYGSSIAVDVNGNIYATGHFEGNVDFDPGPATYNLDGAGDIFVSKLGPSGNFIWAKQLANNNDDYGNDIAVDGSENVYITGSFQGIGDFDPSSGPANYYPLTSLGYRDIFVSKLDASGNFLWAKQMGGGNSNDVGNSIAVDANGNVYTTGYFFSAADFDPGSGIYNLTSTGGADIFVSKLNSSGNFLCAGQLGGTANSSGGLGSSIAVDANENVYATGYFTGIADFDPGNGTYNLTSPDGQDIFVVKLCKIETPTITGLTSFCQGNSVTLTASSANSYLWSNGATTQSITVSSAGNYSVTVTNASGCSAASITTTVIVNSLPSPPIITAVGPTSFCQGSSVTLTASSASSYLWSNGATTQSIIVSLAGNYSVTVTNASGCSAASTSTVVTVISSPPPTISTNGSTTFCQGSSVTLTASSASSYVWSNGATTQSITVSSAGNYLVTVTNTNGCTASSSPTTVTIIQLPAAAITANGSTTFCQGNSVTLTASSANSYLWSNGSTTQSITVSSAGNYSVTITNANGCTAASSPTTITVNFLPTSTITPSGATTFCEGNSVTLAANLASSYLWSNGATTQNIMVSSSGSYSVTITNANGCTAASSPTTVIVNPSPLIPNITSNASTSFCEGGSVTLTASLASSYLWSNGATTQSITVSSSGNYSVSVTNANGCTAASTSTTITVNPLPVAMITPISPIAICQGSSIALTASSASSYLWSNGAVTQSIAVSSAGNYSVTVTNANGCTSDSSPTTVTVNPLPSTPSITPNASTTFCQGESVMLTASFASFYLWSNGTTTQGATISTSGSYAVTITDANGCTAPSSATSVIVNPLPTIDLGNDISIQVGQNAVLDATGTGSNYIWSTGETTPMITVTTMGTYSVTATNSFGCTASDEVVVTVTTSTEDQDNKYKITLSPNPAHDVIYIRCEGSSTSSIELIDNLGRLLLEDNSFVQDGATRTMQLDEIPSGTYHLKVTGKGFSKSTSIIKD